MIKCEICKGEPVPFKKKDEFVLYKCDVCGFMQFDYSQASNIFKNAINKIQTKPSKANISNAQTYKQFFTGKNILDLGSGVARCQQGMDVAGVKYKTYTNVDIDTVRRVAEPVGYKVVAADVSNDCFIQHLPQIEYDTIIASHVLEHLPHPVNVLGVWKKLLGEKTLIYIEVPTYDDLYWKDDDFWLVNAHISYFLSPVFFDLMNKHFTEVQSGVYKNNNAFFIGKR